ncbi:uncharacterized protein [Bemisia tabaci]|uniref:uncharacterized protein n=1 Tax=Bemisia tabaci TaxID=7038 RepID=UPI003B27B610
MTIIGGIYAKKKHRKWQFPNCLEAMDGKHIRITKPFHSGSDFFNYKDFFSIVLFALVDADFNFMYVDIGSEGRISDGGVYNHSKLRGKIRDGSLNFPADSALPGRTKYVPYVFLTDDAFALTPRTMKPYVGVHKLGSKQRRFNGCLSRARCVVENAFGISSAVFRVLRKPMLLEPKKATTVLMTVACLHNFLRQGQSSRNMYTPPGTSDETDADGNIIVPGAWRTTENNCRVTSLASTTTSARNYSKRAKEVREEYATFLHERREREKRNERS